MKLGYSKCDADIESFRVLSEKVGKDKDHIVHAGRVQKNVDYATFYVDDFGLCKDEKFVYKANMVGDLRPIIITGVEIDAASYMPLRNDIIAYGWAKDKNNYYLNHRKINVDYSSFRFQNKTFLSDKDSLYVYNHGIFESFLPNHEEVAVITSRYIRSGTTFYYLAGCQRGELVSVVFDQVNHIRRIDNLILQVTMKYCIREDVPFCQIMIPNHFKRLQMRTINVLAFTHGISTIYILIRIM